MMLILFYVLLLNIISTVEECPISGIHGELLGCVFQDEDISLDVFQNALAVKDTTCVVENHSGVSHAHCNGTDWILEETIRNEKHSRRKRGWFRKMWRGVGNFFSGVVRGAVCVVTFFSCLWGGRAGPVDHTAPNIVCPELYKHPVADPYQLYAKVSWIEPTAYDEVDGAIQPKRKSGRAPGRHFPEGTTKITYEAKDRAGNRASCTVTVDVTIVRCEEPIRIQNGYYQCHPVTEFLYGGTCTFGCYEGFDLHGASRIECQKTGKWSKAQPVCKPWKCETLPQVQGAGHPTCDKEFYFRSICSYNCLRGFDMPPKVSKALVCDKTKTWRKFGEPKCIDVEPPVFNMSTCPSVVIRGTDEAANSTVVTWIPPEASDNSNQVNIQETKILRGARLIAGTYSVKYKATDDAGNSAVNDCSFQVVVREIRCPRIYPTPYLHVDCQHGYGTGARCDVSCEQGKVLIGSNDVKCERHRKELFGDWNWKTQQQTVCKNGKKCVELPPPRNGAVACDNWEGGQFCQVQCKNGTAMSSVSLNKLYVCLGSGEWSVKLPGVRTCREIRHSHIQHAIGIKAAYYFNGDCTDPTTQEQIAKNFIAALQKSSYEEVCPDETECNSANVQIACGGSSRRKREINSTVSNNVIEVQLQLPVSLRGNKSFTFLEEKKQSMLHSVEQILKENATEIFGEGAVSNLQVSSSGFQLICPEGSVKSEESWNCIDCPEGTFFVRKPNNTVCEACRKGTYQDKSAQLKCTRCPVGKTTHTVGATSVAECEDACKPGSYSRDGLFPCSPCEHGYYQPSFGRMTCNQCRYSKSTLTVGAVSASECEDFDIQLVPGEKTLVTTTTKDDVTVKEFTLAFWLQNLAGNVSEEILLPTVKFLDNQNNITWEWQNLKSVIRQNHLKTDVNFKFPDTRWHHVTLYYSSSCQFEVTLDGIPLPTGLYTGDCDDTTVNGVSISADPKFKGGLSQFHLWKGKHTFDNRHRCFSKEVGSILKWKDFEEARLSGTYFQFSSQCDDFNNCISSPCVHGTCSDALHGFSCRCDNGFIGTHCDINIDDCDTNICMNGATCVDGIANYTCSCSTNFTGTFCETKMVDGGWSGWGNWSECSVTCGDGEIKRKRLCNNPSPDNGGKNCEGETLDYRNCNSTECPVCPQISTPSNGSLDCINDTESINCTISCDDGFDFDIEPLPLYYCGPDTFNEWNFQTDENKERRLPRCVAIQLPDVMRVTYTAHYRDLFCANADWKELATEQIDLAVQAVLSNVLCLQIPTCNLSYVNVLDCDSNMRDRRSAKTAGFTLQIISSPTEENKNETLTHLEKAFQDIQSAADNGELTVDVLDDEYELDGNLTDVSGEVVCGPGLTRVKFYCVPCGKGAYLYTDYCKPCPLGTYQDREGQSSCNSCPKGKSTIGIRSTSISDCTVDELISLEDGFKVTGIIVGCACAVVVVVIGFFIYRRYKSKQKKMIVPTDINLPSSSMPASYQAIGTIGPSNKKFHLQSLNENSGLQEESVDCGESKTPGIASKANSVVTEKRRAVHGSPWR